MNTQLFVKPESRNLVYNNRFEYDLSGWNTYEVDLCGNYFKIDQNEDKLVYNNANNGGTCSTTLSVTSSQTTLEKGRLYDFKIITDYSGTFSQSLRLNLGGNLSSYLTSSVNTGTIQCGSSQEIGIEGYINGVDSFDVTYLYVAEKNEFELDLYGDIDIPITYTIADIREPDKRKSSFAKSFTVPSTPNNDKIFGHIFKISGDINPNPNKAVEIYIVQDGRIIFEGILQLTNIKIDSDYKIEYEVDCSGKYTNVYFEWENLKLTDLDYSEYYHTYNKVNQINTWETSIQLSGVTYSNFNKSATYSFTNTYYDSGYLGLEYGVTHSYSEGDYVRVTKTSNTVNPQYNGWYRILEVTTPYRIVLNCGYGIAQTSETGTTYKISPKGEGYLYPMIDYGNSDNTYYDVEKTYPAIYLYTYLKKSFEKINYLWESTFLESDYFKSLVIPASFDSFKITGEQVQERIFKASKTTDEFIRYNYDEAPTAFTDNVNLTVLFDDDSSAGNFDENFVYNTSNGKWTVNKSGNYDIVAKLDLAAKAVPDIFPAWMGAGTTQQSINITGTIWMMKKNLAGIVSVLDSNNFSFNGNNQIVQSPGLVFPTQHFTVDKLATQFFAGEEIWIEIDFSTNGSYGSYFNDNSPETYACGGECGNPLDIFGQVYLNVKSGSFYNKVNNQTIPEGSEVDLKNAVPDVLIKDLFTSIVRAFNLYIEVDKENERKLIIETRNDFYSTSEYDDWTELLDNGVLEIKPMGEQIFKDYVYTYKEDKDRLNEDYTKSWKEIYGQKSFTIDNDFVKEKYETKLIFSPTPLQDVPAGTDRVISVINKLDGAVTKPIASNIRLLYYGGVKYSTTTWTYKSIVTGNTTHNYYAYAGHIDDAFHPTEDLNFSNPQSLYYDYVEWTNNNLFNKYHRQMVEEITDKNSKLVTGYFKLRSNDIYKLNFRKNIFVDGIYYRLNKIIDYNANSPTLTKCELLLTITKPTINPLFHRTIFLDEGFPNQTNRTLTNGNTNHTPTVSTSGYDIYVSETCFNVNVTGNNINIHSYANNIDISNSNNITVYGGLSGISVFNSSNLTITESDVTYINNIRVKNGIISQRIDVIDGSADIKIGKFNSVLPQNLIDASEDDVLDYGSAVPENIIDSGEI